MIEGQHNAAERRLHYGVEESPCESFLPIAITVYCHRAQYMELLRVVYLNDDLDITFLHCQVICCISRS